MKNHVGFSELVIRPVYFVLINLESGPFRACTADRNIEIDEEIWYGVGTLGSISEYTSKVGTEATTVKMTLMGLPGELIDQIVNENTRDKDTYISIALVDEDMQLLAPPAVWFYGGIDSLQLEVGKQITAVASASSRLINWARSANTRYTDEDQQINHPGDRGFKFIAGLANLQLTWGA